MVAFYNQGDQNIYKDFQYVPQEKYRLGFTAPTAAPTAEPVSGGITNTNAFTNSGGDNDFNRSFSNNPYTAQPSGSFVTNRTGYGTSDYLSGTEPEETFMDKAGGLIKKGIGMAIPGGNFLMGMAGKLDNFKNLSAQDKAFIEMQMGNQEQSLHGGNMPNQDRYGYNKRSMFGNYSNVVADRVAIANARIAAGKGLRDIDNYYLEKQKEEDDIKGQIDFNNFVKQRMTANNIRKQIKEGTIDEGFNIHTDPTGTPPGGKNSPDNYGAQGLQKSGSYGGNDTYSGQGSTVSSSGDVTDSSGNYSGNINDEFAKGGRAGYFFGGRVNYKQGGEIAGPGDTGGEGGEDPQDQSDSQFGGGGDNNNNNPPPTFYDNGIQVITNQSKLGFNYPTGLTKNLGIGQLTAILDAKKSLEEEEPEGTVQYDSSIGPVDTRATFDTTTGPELNASYTNNNFNANLNTKTGLSSGYSKKIGPGTLTLDGNLRPDGTYDTKAKYGIYFANGGLASIL